jgi:hypothetical protein
MKMRVDVGGYSQVMYKPVVLLSATIHCKETPFLKRQDPATREADYKWAIKGWMEVDGFDTMIFCENSGADLSRLEKYAASIDRLHRKLIFLSCDKNLGASERGKGYGEMETIRHALDALTDLPPEQMLLKVTGRYRARNAARLISRLSGMQGEIFSDMRKNLTFADSGIFAITVKCAREHLLPRQDELNDFDNKCFENVLADAVHGAILAGGRWAPLPLNPSLYGFSGTYGVRVGFSPLSRLKAKVKYFLARQAFSNF